MANAVTVKGISRRVRLVYAFVEVECLINSSFWKAVGHNNGHYVLFVQVRYLILCVCRHYVCIPMGFPLLWTRVLPCIHDRVPSLYLLPVFLQVRRHQDRSRESRA